MVRLLPDVILTATTGNTHRYWRQLTPPFPWYSFRSLIPSHRALFKASHDRGATSPASPPSSSRSAAGRLDLLKQMSPGLAAVAVLMSPETDPQSKFWLRSVEAAAPSLGVEVMAPHLHTTSDLGWGVERFSRRPDVGLVWPTGTFVTTHAKRVVDLATRYRLPAIYPSGNFVTSGGLMYYGYDQREIFRQASFYRPHP